MSVSPLRWRQNPQSDEPMEDRLATSVMVRTRYQWLLRLQQAHRLPPDLCLLCGILPLGAKSSETLDTSKSRREADVALLRPMDPRLGL